MEIKFNKTTHIKTKNNTYISREDKTYWEKVYLRYLNDDISIKTLSEEIGITNQILFRCFKKFGFKLVSLDLQQN